MMRSFVHLFSIAPLALSLGLASSAAAQTAASAKTLSLATTEGLTSLDAKLEAVEYRGRKAVRITTLPNHSNALALIDGVDFRDGMIEADIAVKITVPPPTRMPGFTGIGFRLQRDPLNYDLFYIRPGNSVGDDQSYRNHSVQYSAEPDFGWMPLRRQWPFIYEAYADLEPGAWTKMKIEVHGRRAVLYLNGSSKPALIVDGLKGRSLNGAIGLWGFTGEESYFSNLKITPSTPEPVRNGGEIADTWQVALNTDVGPFKGTANLSRDGEKITGAWSGSLGEGLPISGTWRDGYVQFSFTALTSDTKEPYLVRFAGWVDDDKAAGRVQAVGQADGRWSATRTKQ
ncbi:MAG TPA: hypothetical protein VIM60_07240 [Edaphobacter sp.]